MKTGPSLGSIAATTVIATDGQKGVRDHAGIPAGEALATARFE